jgi:tetratricopeptide (TPR) repeat protein
VCLLSGKELIGFIVALLFGIHPLHVESVVWISERKDVLYSTFFLGALISYLYYLKKNTSVWYYCLSLFLFILSLLSKAMAMTLPFVLLLFDYISYRKLARNILFEKITFFVAAALFGIITIFTQPFRQEITYTIFDRIIFASYGLLFYLAKFILPIKLSCLYPYPEKIGGTFSPLFLFSPPLLAALIGTVFFLLRRRREIVFGTLFFLITILPVLQLLPIGWAIAADRYTYIPSIGIFYIAGEGCYWLYKKRLQDYKILKGIFPFVLIVIIIMLSFLTFHRSQVWKDSVTLWSDVIKNYPDTIMAYNNRGSAYLHKGEFSKAISDYSHALKINPNHLVAFDNLLRIYWTIGMKNEAKTLYKKATETNPNYEGAYNNLGNVYWKIGKKDDAITLYKMVIELNPDNAEAHKSLALAYYYNGEYSLAVYHLNRVIELGHKVQPELLELLKPYMQRNQ